MTRPARVAGVTALCLVLAGAAYLTADAYDAVPGFVTLDPVPAPPPPFPTPPGAATPAPGPSVLPSLDPQAPVPDTDAVAGLLAAALADSRLGPSTGAVVVDQLTGRIIAQARPDVARTPASTAKLVTVLGALGVLGPEARFTTSVVRGSGAGQIVLVGGGDVMLAAGAGDPLATNGRAGLADLAEQTAQALRLSGDTTVRLLLDDSLFSGATVSPGWRAAYLAGGYVAPVAAIEVDIAKLRSGDYPPRQRDPALAAARTFAQALADRGVTVEGTPSRGSAPSGGATIASVASASVQEIVAYTLRTSDNTVTEALGRMVAVKSGFPASFGGATKAVLSHLAHLGIDTAGAHLVDCSGLADGSRLAPRTLADILLLATSPRHPEYRPIALELPVAGLSGTLADRFLDSDARGVVRAKTGSLPGVTSLAGTVLDADGRLLVFVLIADKTPDGGQTAPRRVLDAFVDELAKCGCAAGPG